MNKLDFSGSYFLKFWQFLFNGKEGLSLDTSIIGGWLNRLYLKNISAILLALAMILFWYESILARIVPSRIMVLLPPLLILASFLFSDKSKTRLNRPIFWYLAFLTVGIISGILASFRGLNPTMLLLGWIVYAVFAVVLLTAQALENKKIFLEVLFWSLLPSAILGIWQFLSKKGLYVTSTLSNGRAVGSFSNPNVFGMVLVLGIIIGTWLFFSRKSIFVFVATSSMVLALLVTGSRTAWLALLSAILVLAAVTKNKWLKIAPLALVIFIIPSVQSRVTELFTRKYRYQSSVDGRIWATNNGIYIWGKNQFLGTGPGSYGGSLAEKYTSPVGQQGLQNGYRAIGTTDNTYIEMLVQLGALGLLTFFGFIISAFTVLLKSPSRFKLPALAALSAFLVMGTSSNVIEFNAVSLLVAILIGFGLGEA